MNDGLIVFKALHVQAGHNLANEVLIPDHLRLGDLVEVVEKVLELVNYLRQAGENKLSSEVWRELPIEIVVKSQLGRLEELLRCMSHDQIKGSLAAHLVPGKILDLRDVALHLLQMRR